VMLTKQEAELRGRIRGVSRKMFNAHAERPGNAIREVRWSYFAPVADYIEAGRFMSALELGPGRCPVAGNAVLMAERKCGDIQLDIVHDAREVPWPIFGGAVELFVALQVFEHLGGRQREAWLEVERITTREAIISIPYKWPRDYGSPGHAGLNEDTVLGWTGREPWRFEVAKGRAVFWFKMEESHGT
jgi:hypothetical protein